MRARILSILVAALLVSACEPVGDEVVLPAPARAGGKALDLAPGESALYVIPVGTPRT